MKTLTDNIRKAGKWVGRGACLVAAVGSIFAASCKLPGPEPNVPPKISEFYVTNPVEVNSPADVILNGTDANGDKIGYKVVIDSNGNNQVDSTDELIASSNNSPIASSYIFSTVGTKKLIGQLTDPKGASDTKSISVVVSNVPVDDYLDVEGWLRNEDNLPQGGRVKVYNSGVCIGEVPADPTTGHFYFISDSVKAKDLSQVTLRAISTDASGNQNGYVGKANVNVNALSEPDVIVNPMGVVLSNDLGSWSPSPTPEQFKTFANQTNAAYEGMYPGLGGFDLNEIIQNQGGVEILRGDPLAQINSLDFTPENQTYLKGKIDNPNDIGAYVPSIDLNGGKPDWIDVQLDNNLRGQDPTNKHYTYLTHTDGTVEIVPDIGWIVVTPRNSSDSETIFFRGIDASRIKRARIDLGTINDTVSTHEFGHVFIAANYLTGGHVSTPPFYYASGTNALTILTPDNISLTNPGPADKKLAKMVRGIFNGVYQFGKPLDEILGTDTF